MKNIHLRRSLLMGLVGFPLLNTAFAGIPLWTFAPVAGFPPSVTVSTTGTATIKYTITNQSHKLHTLQMKPIQGITPSGCTSPLGYQQSCTLSLSVTGSALRGDVTGGPVLCDRGNPNQCYQPSQANILAIRLTKQPPIPQFTVTPSAGANGSISPSTAQVVNSGATLTFIATPHAGYGVDQWLVDGNLVQTGGTTYQLANITANHTVNVTFGTVTLTPSISTLALSINCQPASSCTTTQNAALTGNQRQITIQNTGSVSATHVSVQTLALGLPSGTSIISNTCSGTLNAGSSCTITLKPGDVASSDASNNACTSGTQPVASTITITADGGLSTQVKALVLGYGCQYQGGFLFAVDDTTPNTGSIGGTVVSLVDQAPPWVAPFPNPPGPGVPWDADPACGPCTDITGAQDLNHGQNLASVIGSTNPSGGGTNGPGNTWQISSVLNGHFGNSNTPPATYAAGVCISYSSGGFSDWYLPSTCEMDSVSTSPPHFNFCSLATQSIAPNLIFLIGSQNSPTPSTSCNPPSGTKCMTGEYWMSSEDTSAAAPLFAWAESFDSSSSTNAASQGKGEHLGVRCIRQF